jgi:hypothetical protein
VLIIQISGFEITGIGEPFYHPRNSSRENAPACLVTRRLAFLDLKDDPEKEQIQKKLEQAANPPFVKLLPHEKRNGLCLMLLAVNSVPKGEDVFYALCDAAQEYCNAPQSTRRRFYSAQELFEKDRTAFKRIVKSAGLSIFP